MSMKVLPQARVIKAVRTTDRREFSLFLGAGASRSSGVPLAGEMIQEWRREAYFENHARHEVSDQEIDAWCAGQEWAKDPEREYSDLFEALYHNEPLRQKYVEEKIERAFPSWGYLYLASILSAGYFNITYTTNFDDLINDALSVYLGYNPLVCAADSLVGSINPTSDRVKIIKLHGDYLFKRLKNTREELVRLDPNMAAKLREFSRHRGLVVLGYGGRDLSVMGVFKALLDERGYFPNDVYWGLRDGEEPSGQVAELATSYPERFRLYRCHDFDTFMAELHRELGLELPEAVHLPYKALERTFRALVLTEGGARDHPLIQQHSQALKEKLGGLLAKAEASPQLALLEAQLLLARRDWEPALEKLEAYLESHPEDVNAETARGAALAIGSEETGETALMERAAAAWRRASELDPEAIAPRRQMVAYHMARNRPKEAISEAEPLLDLAPRDVHLRLHLATLYMRVHRPDEALALTDTLIERSPNDPVFRAVRAEILGASGRGPEAVQEAERAVEMDPGNAWYRFGYGNILLSVGRIPQGEAEIRRAIEMDPENPMILQRLFALLASTGRLQEAWGFFQRLERVAPAVAGALQAQVEAMQQMQRASGASPAMPAVPYGPQAPSAPPEVPPGSLQDLLRRWLS